MHQSTAHCLIAYVSLFQTTISKYVCVIKYVPLNFIKHKYLYPLNYFGIKYLVHSKYLSNLYYFINLSLIQYIWKQALMILCDFQAKHSLKCDYLVFGKVSVIWTFDKSKLVKPSPNFCDDLGFLKKCWNKEFCCRCFFVKTNWNI